MHDSIIKTWTFQRLEKIRCFFFIQKKCLLFYLLLIGTFLLFVFVRRLIRITLILISTLVSVTVAVHGASLGPATILAGAARLDNGSLVSIGQPFVGTFGSAGGISGVAGIVPILIIVRNPLNQVPAMLECLTSAPMEQLSLIA